MSDLISLAIGDGGAVCIARGPVVALVDTRDAQLIERLWNVTDDDPSIDGLLSVLMAGGLSALGSFVLAARDLGSVRLLVRGEGRARITSATGERVVDAGATHTWVEDFEVDIESVTLTIGQISAAGTWRFREGVIPALGAAFGRAEDTVVPTTGSTAVPHAGGESSAPDTSGRSDVAETPVDSPSAEPVEASPHTAVPEEDPDDLIDDREPAASGGSLDRDSSGTSVQQAGQQGDADDLDPTSDAYDYDSLFGKTRHRSVAGAAVLLDEDGNVVQGAPGGEPASDQGTSTQTSEPPASRDESAVDAPPPPPANPAGAPTSIITAVPGAGAPPTPSQPSNDTPGDRFGDTLARPSGRSRSPGAKSGTSSLGGAVVQAVACPSGHVNPPQRTSCRACAAALVSEPIEIPRPVLGHLVVSTGLTITLDRPVILGRNPRVEGRIPNEVPRTEAFAEHSGVSRTHLIVRLEGWDVLAEDLGSSNGTFVTLPGQPPRRLHAGVPVHLVPGSLIDLANEVTMTFEDGG